MTDEMKNMAEDVEIIEDSRETEIITAEASNTKEPTEEQKALQEQMYRNMFIRRWKHIFTLMHDRMQKYKLTIEDLKKEVENKTSPFTKSQREFITGMKTEFLDQCLNDLFKGPKYL